MGCVAPEAGLGGQAPNGHGYGVGCITWFTRLVLEARLPMRATSRVLEMISEMLGRGDDVPHWTTGRRWLQRLGLAMLTKPLAVEVDWAWLIDHSVQIGQEKCFVILGIRLCDLPEPGTSLKPEDLELVALVLRKSWTGSDVDAALEAAVARTGVPRVIVSDHGGDVASGIALFQERHPDTADIYDFKHKAACLMKNRLENNPDWKEFQAELNLTRNKIQQTELGFLTPAALKIKARFMNLGDQLAWGGHILDLLQNPPLELLQNDGLKRLQEKLGWVERFRSHLREWGEWQQIVDSIGLFVNQYELYWANIRDLKRNLPSEYAFATSQQLANELLEFVRGESAKAQYGERLPGSTEALESCFGKFKVLEREQSRTGFTTLLAAFGTMVMKITQDIVTTSMQHTKTQTVIDWCKDNITTSFASLRKLAFNQCASKTA